MKCLGEALTSPILLTILQILCSVGSGQGKTQSCTVAGIIGQHKILLLRLYKIVG